MCALDTRHSDFLRSFDDPSLFETDESLLPFLQPFPSDTPELPSTSFPSPPKVDAVLDFTPPPDVAPAPSTSHARSVPEPDDSGPQDPPIALPGPTKNERYLLTAADQRDGPRNERLARVIHAKYEAGLLKPFDHVAGYKRLMRWMETNVRGRHGIQDGQMSNSIQMSASSRTRTLQTISEFRPRFRVRRLDPAYLIGSERSHRSSLPV
jgi:hypothetical protein